MGINGNRLDQSPLDVFLNPIAGFPAAPCRIESIARHLIGQLVATITFLKTAETRSLVLRPQLKNMLSPSPISLAARLCG